MLPSAAAIGALRLGPLARRPPKPGAAPLPPQNQFDSIDLSDNAVVRLEGFPRLPRLRVLYLCNNRVAKIARNLQGAGSAAAPCALLKPRPARPRRPA
jgi:hypothetical protein